MQTREKLKVLFWLDDEGYITGYQSEFYEAKSDEWVTPFDTTNAVELTRDQIESIELNVSKIIDGEIINDPIRQRDVIAREQAAIQQDKDAQLIALKLQMQEMSQTLARLTEVNP